MKSSGVQLILIWLIAASVSCWTIDALRAGTIFLSDDNIRETAVLNKQIDLDLKKQFVERYKGIEVIASITSLSMDDKLSFYFLYNIVCPDINCFLNFTFVRKTLEMNSLFKYSLTIDYLVGLGFRVLHLNMTSYQEHLMMSDIKSYDSLNNRENFVQKLPYNNKDAMQVLLFPNGFSNLTRTGRVVHLYVMGTEMYVVHYMDPERHSQKDSQGWPEGADFINYKILFFQADYQPRKGCQVQIQFELFDHYQKLCDGGKNLKWFFGFKSTKESEIMGEFFELRSGYSFSLSTTPADYGLLAFPFQATKDFVDHREHQYKFTGEYLMIGQVAGLLLLTFVIGGSLFLSYKFIKKLLKLKNFNKLKGRENSLQTEVEQKTQESHDPRASSLS